MKKFLSLIEWLENEVCERLQEYENGNEDVWNMEEENYSFTEVEFDSEIFDYVSGEWLEEYLKMYANKHFQFRTDIQFTLTDEGTILIEI